MSDIMTQETKILIMHESGMTGSAIAKHFGLNKKSVSYIITKYYRPKES